MLLGPFRVRNLHRPASPSNQTLGGVSRPDSRGAVCVVTGREYHNNAIRHPETRLRYLDDEDGELVTVGSSLELVSRLREPICRRTKATRSIKPTQGVAPQEPSSPLSRPVSPDLHVFEIETRGDSEKIWQEIAQKTKELQLQQNVAHPGLVTNVGMQNQIPLPIHQIRYMSGQKAGCSHFKNPKTAMRPIITWDMKEDPNKDDLSVNMDPSDDVSRLQELKEQNEIEKQGEDEREFYFKTSHPPQLSQANESIQDEPSYTRLASSEDEHEAETKEETPLLASFHEGNLTEEGKRQAILAGNQLRARTARTNPIRHPKSSRDLRTLSSDKNRWASYSGSKPFALEKAPEKAKPRLNFFDEPSRSPEPEGSLLQAFQAELAKISKPATTSTSAPLSAPKADDPLQGFKDKGPGEAPLPLQPLWYGPRIPGLKTLQSFTDGFQNLASTLRSGLEKEAIGRPMSDQSTKTHSDLVELLGDFESQMMAISESTHLLGANREKANDSIFYEDHQSSLNEMLMRSLKEVAQSIEALGVGMSSVVSSPNRENAPIFPPRSTSEIVSERESTVIISNIPLSAGWGEVRDLIYSQNGKDKGSGQSSSEGILAITIEEESNDFPRRVKCQVLGYERALRLFERLDGWYFYNNRLLTTIASSNSAESTHRNSTKPDGTVNASQHNKPAQVSKPSGIPVKQKPFKPVVPLTARPRSFDYTKIPAVLNTRESRVPSVRFVEPPPTIRSKASAQQSLYPGREGYKAEPIISYRHVSSPRPWDTLGDRNERQPSKLYPGPSHDGLKNEQDTMPNHLERRSTPATFWPNGGFLDNRSTTQKDPDHSSQSPLIPPFASSISGNEKDVISSHQGSGAESSWFGEPPRSVKSAPPRPMDDAQERESSSVRSTRVPLGQNSIDNTLFASGNDGSIRHEEQRRIREDDKENSIDSTRTNRLRRWRSLHPSSTPSVMDIRSFMTSKSSPEPVKVKDLRHARSMGAMEDLEKGIRYEPESLASEPATEKESSSLKGKARRSFRPWVEEDTALDNAVSGSANESSKSPQAATRFPTLEQFESRNNKNVPQFPPLPSMEPLVPLRANAVNNERGDSVSELSTANIPSLESSKTFFPALELNEFKAHREAERKASDEAAEKHAEKMKGLKNDLEGKYASNSILLDKTPKHGAWLPDAPKPRHATLPTYSSQTTDVYGAQRQNWAWVPPVSETVPESISSGETARNNIPEKTESSGQFFKRMTGLDDAPDRLSSPLCSIRSPPVAPAARLAGPFDPLAETAAIHRHKIIEGVHRAATISSGPDDRWTTRNRRPYSEYFSGNGRVEWDRFVQGYTRPELRISVPGNPHRRSLQVEPSTTNSIPTFETSSGPVMNRTTYNNKDGTKTTITQHNPSHSTISTSAVPSNSSPSKTIPSAAIITTHNASASPPPLPPPPPPPYQPSTLPTHHDASTVSTIQKCVEQLKNLGFGGEGGENGGDGEDVDARLVIYAQAAEGDVNEAIDILTEERKVWNERSRKVPGSWE